MIKGSESSAKLKGRVFEVTVPDRGDTKSIKKSLNDWYRDKAEARFQTLIDDYSKVVGNYGEVEPNLAIRKMKTRWGSCSASGRITLNLYLIQTPSHCIEYVVMHELCRMVEHNHSKRFYKLLSTCMPDWSARKNVINGFSVNEI